MNINTEKKYKVIIELTDEEVKELDRQAKSSSAQVKYDEIYEPEAICDFKDEIFKKILEEVNNYD